MSKVFSLFDVFRLCVDNGVDPVIALEAKAWALGKAACGMDEAEAVATALSWARSVTQDAA